MVLQNRQGLDWILAEKGGVCQLFGEHCWTFVPEFDESFSVAMTKLWGLKKEFKENAGKDCWSWDGLDQILGKWGAQLVKIGIMH